MTVVKSALKGDVLRHVQPAHEQQNLLLVLRILGNRWNNARLFKVFPLFISNFFHLFSTQCRDDLRLMLLMLLMLVISNMIDVSFGGCC